MRYTFSILLCSLFFLSSCLDGLVLISSYNMNKVATNSSQLLNENLEIEKSYPCAGHECGCSFETCFANCCCSPEDLKPSPLEAHLKGDIASNLRLKVPSEKKSISLVQRLKCQKDIGENKQILTIDRPLVFGDLKTFHVVVSPLWRFALFGDFVEKKCRLNIIKPPVKPPIFLL